MQQHGQVRVPSIVCSALLLLVCVRSDTGFPAVEAAHAPGQTANVCHGFVVLPNGFAVLSGIPAVPERAPARATPGQEPASSAMGEQEAARLALSPQASAAPAHLMDYQHGQDDHRLPGGHGPTNDPEVHGLVAHPDGPGRYIVPNINFTMAGLWFVEIQVHEGARMSKAYFGVAVGEE